MRKLILMMQLTLDGFAAGPNGENDWVFLPGRQDPAAMQFTLDLAAQCDTLLMGRKLVAEFCTYWENVADNQPDNPWHPLSLLMVGHRKIAFTRTGATVTARNLEVATADLATTVQALKSQPGKDLLVYGGVDFVSSLMRLNLIDVYHLIINPVAIGSGMSIFTERKILDLQSTVPYLNGKVLHTYVRGGR